jgi:hypothetical protein
LGGDQSQDFLLAGDFKVNGKDIKILIGGERGMIYQIYININNTKHNPIFKVLI